MKAYVRSLQKLAKRYRIAEAEVVRAYFKKPRAKKDHLRWLKAQAFKEFSAIKPLLGLLTRLYPYLDKGMDRHEYEKFGEKLAEETKHARLIMDLLEKISGRKLTLKELPWLPEDKRLARIRARYSKTYAGPLHGSEAVTVREIRRKDEEIERAAITFTEGGGGALYEVCAKLKNGKVEREIASVFKDIHFDEVKHKNAGGRILAKLVRTEKEYECVAEVIRRVSGQRLRMLSPNNAINERRQMQRSRITIEERKKLLKLLRHNLSSMGRCDFYILSFRFRPNRSG